VDWGGHVHPLLLEVAPEIDINPTSFYRGSLRLQTPVIGSRSALAMFVHPTYFDLATLLFKSRYADIKALKYFGSRTEINIYFSLNLQ